MDRRAFLRLGFLATSSLAMTRYQSGPPQPAGISARLSQFIDPLPIPPRLQPHRTHNGEVEYHVLMCQFQKKLHSQLPPTTLWGYEGMYPGPTIEARRGQKISVKWDNQLPKHHLFKVDSRLHGAMPPAPEVRAVTHLHGGRNRPEDDGAADSWWKPGESRTFHYPNQQPAATLWYHDHAVGITRLNVYAGLAGFYLLRDEQEQALNLPAGDFEVPMLLQDRTVDEAGQLVYSPTHDDGVRLPPGVWGPEFFGDLPVVNGAAYPYLDVEPRPYRLRIVNGGNSRYFRLFLNLAKTPYDIPQLRKFHQIGGDAGLLPSPVQLESVLLGPAERADLIVDFSGLSGKTATLSNDALAPFPGWEKESMMHGAPLNEIMQFKVTRPLSAPVKPPLERWSVQVSPLDPSLATNTRDLALYEYRDSVGHSLGMKINGKSHDDPVTETIKLGTIEKWRFINTTMDAHSMHLHMLPFRVVERQGFDKQAFAQGSLRLVGPRRHDENESGWKDTARVNPGEVLTIAIRFDGYPGTSTYHCHMLEHEDNDMMRPYLVVT